MILSYPQKVDTTKSWWQHECQLKTGRCPMSGESVKKRRFDRDFKISAVKMVTEGGHKASEVARSLGIDPNQLYSWKHKFSDSGEKAFPGKGNLTELAALRRKLKDVEM